MWALRELRAGWGCVVTVSVIRLGDQFCHYVTVVAVSLLAHCHITTELIEHPLIDVEFFQPIAQLAEG